MEGNNNEERIYLDHNATTPLDPSAVEAMLPFMKGEFGNPSSPYPLGRRAKEALEEARKDVALLLGCEPGEVVFTSGGSESNNAVIKGLIDYRNPGDFHVITSAVEHPAVLNPVLYLMELGSDATVVPVDRFCRVEPEEVAGAIRPDTRLISVMLANNETGTLEPIREIAAAAGEYGIPVHTDAAQAVGKIDIRVRDLGVDFLSLAGHKLYGPKGIGALFIREGRTLTPLIHGAGQEGGRRPGTENVMLSVGLGAACRVARERLRDDMARIGAMRDRLETLLFEGLDGLVLNGHPVERLPNTLNVSVPGLEGAMILDGLQGLCASTGAACHDRSVRLSHVLSAMAVPADVGMGALRLTLGRENTMQEIEYAARMLIERVKEMRNGR